MKITRPKLKPVYIDQYGQRYYAETIAELRQQIPGRCSKMYITAADDTSWHVGYVIGHLWLNKYDAAVKRA